MDPYWRFQSKPEKQRKPFFWRNENLIFNKRYFFKYCETADNAVIWTNCWNKTGILELHEKSKTKFTIFCFCFEQKTTLRWCAFYLGKVYVVIMYVFNSNEITRSKDGTKNPEKIEKKWDSPSVCCRSRCCSGLSCRRKSGKQISERGRDGKKTAAKMKIQNSILVFIQKMI